MSQAEKLQTQFTENSMACVQLREELEYADI